ncbi:MAG: hypothetical protein GX673_00935 [Gammaproteobacteria bacterium]|nr:hypothetical protein [Gammaproteobacteria bacterium]
MEIKVGFLDNPRLEAKFDDFTVVSDQPIRYKGEGFCADLLDCHAPLSIGHTLSSYALLSCLL